jgi:hypothetical protein
MYGERSFQNLGRNCNRFLRRLWYILSQITFTNREYSYVRFEILKAVVMKSSIFWDITPCSPLKTNRRFRGTCRLHLQGRISRARNQRALLATCFHAGFLSGLFFNPEDGGDMFLRNVGWLSTEYMALYPRRQNPSENIPPPHSARLGSGPSPPSYPMHVGAFSPGVQLPGRETDNSTPASAKMKNAWSCTPFPYTSSWRGA